MRVLVVSDDAELRSQIKRILPTSLSATTLEAGLWIVKTGRPDLLILDSWLTPGLIATRNALDGFWHAMPDAKVILVSTTYEQESEEIARALGAVGYAKKEENALQWLIGSFSSSL